jgi:hypothetical protein
LRVYPGIVAWITLGLWHFSARDGQGRLPPRQRAQGLDQLVHQLVFGQIEGR